MSELWKDKSRICGLPITFTSYRISEDCLYVRQGLFSTVEDRVKLFKVFDVTVRVGLIDKMFNQGTIIVKSTDSNNKTVCIKNVLNPYKVADILDEYSDKSVRKNRVRRLETYDVYDKGDAYNDNDDDFTGDYM